jgi:hypothetical protein
MKQIDLKGFVLYRAKNLNIYLRFLELCMQRFDGRVADYEIGPCGSLPQPK